MPRSSILVVDPDSRSARVAANELRGVGHNVNLASATDDAMDLLSGDRYDLVLLDWSCGPVPTPDVLRKIKTDDRFASVRIVVTADDRRESVAVKILGSGADDLLVTPFTTGELLARVALALRRPPVRDVSASITRAGRIRIDDVSHRVTVDYEPIELAPREYRLLRFFARNADRLFSREQLLALVWGQAQSLGQRTVDVHVRRLRRVLEPFGCETYLETVRGAGYRFAPGTAGPAPLRRWHDDDQPSSRP